MKSYYFFFSVAVLLLFTQCNSSEKSEKKLDSTPTVISKVDSISQNTMESIKDSVLTNADFDDNLPINRYLKIELIDKATYLSQKSTIVNFFQPDTLTFIKKNNVLEIKCENKIRKYVDVNIGDKVSTEIEEYYYIGRIDSLNKYVIRGSYWENSDYKLVDKTTGEAQKFIGYPYVSPDKKYIISMYPNVHGSSYGDLEFYEISNKMSKLILTQRFSKWLPTYEEKMIFWSEDGYLYIPVNHSHSYLTLSGSDNYQYIRIKIK
jgi:hypothetical protein